MYQVIIVDDEPVFWKIIHLFPWNNFGFEVVASFTNGKEALEYINAHPQVDIVMTDIQMPVMTGIELSQKLKNEDIIVIFFSAYQDFEYARAAIINHVTDYLIKPMKYDSRLPALNASGKPGRTGEGPLSALRSQCRRGGLCDDCEKLYQI